MVFKRKLIISKTCPVQRAMRVDINSFIRKKWAINKKSRQVCKELDVSVQSVNFSILLVSEVRKWT